MLQCTQKFPDKLQIARKIAGYADKTKENDAGIYSLLNTPSYLMC